MNVRERKKKFTWVLADDDGKSRRSGGGRGLNSLGSSLPIC